MIRDELSILVVDDMKFSCEFIRRALTREGYTAIEVVNNALDALLRIKKAPYDVVLADWLMPEIDGLEMTRKIRQLDEERNHYTGIVLLTAKDDINSIRQAFDEGVDDYIVKPPNQIELAARVYSAGRVATMQNNLLDTAYSLRKNFYLKCTIDRVTGLGRMADTQRRLDAFLRQSLSRDGATCCAVLRINNFKQLASEHNREVQEQLLKSVSRRICRQVRPMDLVGYINPGEFLIAMHYPNMKEATCRNFKRILHDVNHRSYKTTHGFLNLQCAMAMTGIDKNHPVSDVKELIYNTRQKLKQSGEMGYEEVVN